MSILRILTDGRTNPSTKLVRLIGRIDSTTLLLGIFAGVFFYLDNPDVGWIFAGLTIIHYLFKNG